MGRVLRIWSFIERADWRILRWCEGHWGRSPAFDAAMMAAALYTPFVMLALIAIAASGWAEPARSEAPVWAAAASVGAAVIVRAAHEPISRAARRPRPFEVEPMQALVAHEPGDSFPSNHAAGGFALAVGGWHLGDVAYVLLALAIWLSVARIYCGLHYPSDVVAGAASGAVVGYACSSLQWAYRESLPQAMAGLGAKGL
ncbi:phosphatase PAP2 family protein [Alicyclobacillus sendaiensis]|uniref:Phosphatase PAP2 family protein n=1 Tax=Alicyclobacillus sendaiensis PA2 TaxID=3029425 RepID=A0ABT6XYU5_ALISE|nr:phosphatase PAP2 family protein [Alicyclobacillus sendaiensis]MDI9260160.1 phosphatase PAP2 family protein [Alicyclobacillus sendaiensis PA2]